MNGVWKIAILAIVLALARQSAAGDDAPAGVIQLAADKRITLQAAQGEIRDILRLVAEQGGLNLVIGPEVVGEVSVYLEDVSVATALKSIATNNGFAYTVEENVITVAKAPERSENETDALPTLATRVFTLRSRDAVRVKDALEFALTERGKIKVLNENSEAGYGGTKLSELSGNFDDTNTGSSSSTTAYTTTGGNGSGSGTTNQIKRHSRTLIVTDTKENLPRIADLIADLDQMPPQVLIEARIIEMSVELERQLGIDWNLDVLATGPILNHEAPLNLRAGFSGGTQIRHGPNGVIRTSTGLALGTIDLSRFAGLLRVHQANNAIRLLANPRLLVFNNHSASILVGERYPILEANITDFGTVTEAFDTYIPIGIQLEVTPSILADGRISLLVHPATSALGDEVVGTTGLRVRRILTREIDTRVVMHDGQTVVLGGLISDRKVRTINKIPGLGDLPGFSLFFRQENPRAERVDLLVFLTARVEGATKISERDQTVFDMYRPHFKHIDRLKDLPLHFEVPTEYRHPPPPMFGDPPDELSDAFDEPPAADAADGQKIEIRRQPPDRTGVKAVRAQSAPSAAPSATNGFRPRVHGQAPTPQGAESTEQAADTEDLERSFRWLRSKLNEALGRLPANPSIRNPQSRNARTTAKGPADDWP